MTALARNRQIAGAMGVHHSTVDHDLAEHPPKDLEKSKENNGVPADNPPRTSGASAARSEQVAALMLIVGELQAALRRQGGEIVLLKAELAALREPAGVPAGYVPLKVAAHALGCSDEWLRRKCKRGEIDCRQAIPGGPWYVAVGGTLAGANGRIGNRVLP
jgi:hypothetical protein